jgi:hypothetical protein
MVVEEVEYRKVFMLNKRCVKHWLTNSAHRAYSSTLCMREPAAKTFEFIKSIDNKDKSYKEKIKLLDRFYNEQDHNEKSSMFMGSGYYFERLQFDKRAISNIAKGEPVIIPKMPRS